MKERLLTAAGWLLLAACALLGPVAAVLITLDNQRNR
jgi:hypothetical protein